MAALSRTYRLGEDDDLGIVAGNRICGELSTIATLISAVSIISGWSAIAADIPLSERKSGYQFLARETRAMQDDDTANPGMLGVLQGETLWASKAGAANPKQRARGRNNRNHPARGHRISRQMSKYC